MNSTIIKADSAQDQVNTLKDPVPPVANGNDLTLKQRIWLQVYVETGNATEAAMRAYDCKDRDSAATIGWENLRKLDVPLLMEMMGLTDKRLLNKVREGLDATKIVSSNGGKDITNADNNDFIEVPDYNVQHKYLTTALTLKKRLVEQTNTINIDKMLILDGIDDPNAPNATETIEGVIVEKKPIGR